MAKYPVRITEVVGSKNWFDNEQDFVGSEQDAKEKWNQRKYEKATVGIFFIFVIIGHFCRLPQPISSHEGYLDNSDGIYSFRDNDFYGAEDVNS